GDAEGSAGAVRAGGGIPRRPPDRLTGFFAKREVNLLKSAPLSASSPGLLANRYVRTILVSNVLLQLGIWVRNFAILLYVADVTNNDPYYVSLISIVEFAPIFVFSMIGGTFADRWRPKRTMVWCDLLSAVSVFVVLAAILFG